MPESIEKKNLFSRGISLGEVIGFSLTIILVVGGAWKSIDTRLTIVERDMENNRELYQEIKSDLKEIKISQQAVLLELQNKVNRK